MRVEAKIAPLFQEVIDTEHRNCPLNFMGRIRHSAIIVTGTETPDATWAHAEATSLGLIVTPVVRGFANGYSSFMVCPDGSKECWETSEEFDRRRNSFVLWLLRDHEVVWYPGSPNEYKSTVHLDWAYLDFGGDDDDVVVRDHADNDSRKPQTHFS